MGEPKDCRFELLLGQSMVDDLWEVAEQLDCSMSQVIRTAVRLYLEGADMSRLGRPSGKKKK